MLVEGGGRKEVDRRRESPKAVDDVPFVKLRRTSSGIGSVSGVNH